MKFLEKLKLTYKYYKTLGKEPIKAQKPKAQKMSDLKIRPDAIAFLTCPQPVLESEKERAE